MNKKGFNENSGESVPTILLESVPPFMGGFGERALR